MTHGHHPRAAAPVNPPHRFSAAIPLAASAMTVGMLTCFLGIWLLTGPQPALAASAARAEKQPELVVAAAADLGFAFREIVPAFEREFPVKVRLALGSTGQLAQQIEHGAPFDVFFAANMTYIDSLRAQGYLRPDSIEPYAQGLIVLATQAHRPALSRLEDLAEDAVARVAIANPRHAPYGMAAKEALEKAGLWERLQPKLVYGENITQALQFLRTENVDAAILALSVAQAPEIRYTPIDRSLYRPITQGAAVTAQARAPEMARTLIRFVNGPEGRSIMKRFGFLLPGEF